MKSYTKNLGSFTYSIDFDVEGLGNRAQRAAEHAVMECGEYIRQRSTAIAPYREGPLTASARVHRSGPTSAMIEYAIVYARYQHENTGLRHPNGRQAKYLQSVMESPATQDAIQSIFQKHLGKEL